MKHTRCILCSILLTVFLLGSHRGYIALWQNDDPEPLKILPYKVQMLPPEDQKKLKQGIKIQSFADLSRILEDFTA